MAAETFGALSLVPPLLAIGLAIVTRKAVPSLFVGVWAGAVIFTGGLGVVQTFDWIVAAIIADDGFQATIIVFTLLLGSGVAMVWNLGGSYAVRDWAIEHLDTQRKAGLAAWVLGLIMFFDDYANTAIVGSSMKDVSDELRVSREKLSYIVDSTAAPVATLGISSWVAFQIGLISDAYGNLGVENAPSAFEVFVRSIPFNAYSLLAIVMVLIVVASRRDFGEMLDAEHRSYTTGAVNREDAVPMQDVKDDLGEPHAENPRLVNFFAPVAVLIAVTLGAALWTGGLTAGGFAADPLGALWEAMTGADYAGALVYGSFAMVLSGFALGKAYDILDFGEATDATIDGFGIMLTAVTVLVLAWSIGEVVAALGTAEYVEGFIGEGFPAAVLPVVVLLFAAFVAFSTGTSWGAMGIITPVAIPVAWSVTGDHTMVAAVVGAVFSGAIFGDHTSPISDTTVLSATFTGADLIDHVRTQLYYAVTVVVVAIAVLLAWGVTGVTPFVWLPLGALALVGLVYGLSELDARRKGVSPIATDSSQREK
ncbi:Na+/H+ antiporter NhaC family protein [Haloparvum alkalitolerans]|uniref:DUF401 family protein n=1 Tax=Haloparvum alkalitolerans TaxID=1042953 RepID=UPI003CF6F9B4